MRPNRHMCTFQTHKVECVQHLPQTSALRRCVASICTKSTAICTQSMVSICTKFTRWIARIGTKSRAIYTQTMCNQHCLNQQLLCGQLRLTHSVCSLSADSKGKQSLRTDCTQRTLYALFVESEYEQSLRGADCTLHTTHLVCSLCKKRRWTATPCSLHTTHLVCPPCR